MNATAEILSLLSPEPPPPVADAAFAPAAWEQAVSEADAFVRHELSALVRRVFFPGWPRPAKQVVFTTVEPDHNIGPLCRRIGETLAAQVPGSVCLIDADARTNNLERACNADQPAYENHELDGRRPVPLRGNLSLLTPSRFASAREFSAAWLRNRLSDLRRECDYTIIHAPAVGTYSEVRLLAHLADGAVLVIDARNTRRLAAQRARDVLYEANARLIGAVFDNRPFPIPNMIYRRL